MDRRRLQSRSVLHNRLLSSSQTAIKSGLNSVKENITRSSSAVDEIRGQSRKRKNSEDEDISLSPVSSPVIARKKKRNLVSDDNDDDEVIEESDSSMQMSTRMLNSKRRDRSVKHNRSELNSISKLRAYSDKDDKTEQDDSSGGSYIRGFLEALDKSPAKLSQNSSSSSSKYRKLNLRTPLRSKLQQSKEKSMIERCKEKQGNKSKLSKLENFDKKNVSMQQESKKKKDSNNSILSNISKIESDDAFSDLDDSPIKKLIDDKISSQLCNVTQRKKRKMNKICTELDNSRSNRTVKSSEYNNFISNDSIEIRNVNKNNRKKETCDENNNKFIIFIDSVGITLSSGDNLHIAHNDPREIVQNMKEVLSSNNFNVDELIESWNIYINDEENLRKSLIEMKIETSDGIGIYSKALSLSRFLLQVPQLQVKIFESLLTKLIDAVIISDSSDSAPWAVQMLQQFRFLEILVDPDFLIAKIEELLSSSPEWFQREVIVFIPDIVIDTHHHATAEMLTKIMEHNNDLTNIILDCIHNLILGKEYKEELREQILKLLNNNINKNTLPAVTRFVLDACATETIALKALNAIRLIDVTTSVKKEMDEYYTNQMFIVNAIKINIQLSKEVSQAALTIIKNSTSEAVPLDIIILILLYETITSKKKIVETILFSHIKDGCYKTSLLNILYTGYKQVAKSFQSTALNLAVSLLKADNSLHMEFGIEWMRNIFISQSDTSYKQREILEKLLNLMGSKDKTVKNSLEVLCRIANDEIERQNFQHHAGLLRCFLEKIDHLQFNEVSTLYHLLHGLCTQSETISTILNDDLAIIMQKQLCSSKVVTKCKGVLGAVMAIKHLAVCNETSDQAFELLKRTLNCLKSCVKSQALFYDQLGQIIKSNNNIDNKFLSDITNFFEDNFINNCLVESNTDDNLVPKFGLNDPTVVDSYYVHFGCGKSGATIPVFFKLLRICNLSLSGSLESINAVLGCSVLMPEDLSMPESSTADYMIHCINWFREIITGFVTQDEILLREQVLKRLQSLMTLQGEFVTLLSMSESRYEPPPCYFHHFPVPKFIKLDMKIGKKGNKKGKKKKKKEDTDKDDDDTFVNKSIFLPEWENWTLGSELTIKNPAFFRQMDTNIINLLDIKINTKSSQMSENITIAQVCFIVKELLGMFKNQTSQHFLKDLIKLLPKICNKFKELVSDLRKNENVHEKEAVQLILSLLITLFSWNDFKSAKYDILLCDGLRCIAGMKNKPIARSRKDLIAQAYGYFESLSDIATEISTAVALVNICDCLMKHSTTFNEQSKEKQAKMAHGFLSLEWNNETHGPRYKVAIKELLRMWLENEIDPLETVSSVLEWLPKEVMSLDKPQSRLSQLSSINKINFHLLLKQLFVGLVKGLDLSLNLAETDPERIRIWLKLAMCLENMSNICKACKNNIYLTLFLRYITILYQVLLTSGMKILEVNIKYQTENVLSVIKHFQMAGRFLRDIFCTARKDNNVSLLKIIPIVKSRREKFIYRVKGLLTANNSIGAFWMGNLLNKDLDGEKIITESSEDLTTTSDITNENVSFNDTVSDIFNSDIDDDSNDED